MGLDIGELERQAGNITTSGQGVEGTRTNGVLSLRASDAQLIPLNRKLRKFRIVSDVVFSLMESEDRQITENKLLKRGWGRPRKNPPTSQSIANGSLSDSDFLHCKKVLFREARKTLASGKMICISMIGNEELIVRDIAHLNEEHEKVF
ncbi:hypothetical protein V6N13_101045 [Hibiscus sabdariffa]